MVNSLIACGGTGAHAALAMIRLHTLGHALGFFRQSNDKPLDFPTLYLVDQDSGDGEREETAWQMVRRLVDDHPGHWNSHETFGREDGLSLRIVTPLPVGQDREWSNPANDTLGKRFAHSPHLDLLTDRDQREIQFSRGMMGSPSVGALLFRLKNHDAGASGINHDGGYHTLRRERGRIAVVGSGIGGTGAAVAPTLAREFAASDARVMAVMVLQWFRFTTDGIPETLREKAELRNDAMRQNAHSALAYCGQDLAKEVATVPVGIPETAIVDRRFTSDTEQPAHESFVHGVAALSCLRHFLASEPYHAGLYQMGAEDPRRLGGGNLIPGSGSDRTLQDLANQAATLATTLDAFAGVLAESHSGMFAVVPAIYREIGRLTDPRKASEEIRALTASYRKHLEWMQHVLGVEPQPVTELTTEIRLRKHLIDRPISGTTSMPPREVALALFHWVAEWIATAGFPSSRPGPVNGGYWPPLGGDGLAVAADRAGDLTSVPRQNIGVTLDGFVDTNHVSQNGWPDPIAVADHFRYAIEREDQTARRQLEMLLAGLVTGHLALKEIPEPGESSDAVSLSTLLRETGIPDLARYAVVWPEQQDEILGFNTPHTLLCAKPPSDQHAVQIWASLWITLTGSEPSENWATEEPPTVWRYADREIRQIQSWLGHLKQRHSGAPPAWTRIFDHQPSPVHVPYGTDQRTFPLYWASTSGTVPVGLPKAGTGDYSPGEDTPQISEDELLNEIPQMRKLQSESGGIRYEMVEFEAPDRERQVRGLWKEHLDHLQQQGLIADFGNDADDVFIWMPDFVHAATLERTRILDRNAMMIPRCSPMRQDPVPGSPTRVGSERSGRSGLGQWTDSGAFEVVKKGAVS